VETGETVPKTTFGLQTWSSDLVFGVANAGQGEGKPLSSQARLLLSYTKGQMMSKNLEEGERLHLEKVSDVALHSSLVTKNIVTVITKFSTGAESCYEALQGVDFRSFIGLKLLPTDAACHIVRVP